MNKLRLGIIGTGIIVNEAHLPALLRLTDRFEVTALCNRTRPKAEELAGKLGVADGGIWQDWEKFLAEAPVDALLLALPIEMNYPVSLAAARAGKHVLCEKPVGQSVEEARQAVTLAADHGITFMVAEDCHFVPQFSRAAELVRQGAVGKPTLISWNVFNYMSLSNKYAKTKWRTEHVYPGGYVLDGGVHFVHVLQMIAGPIASVRAESRDIDPRLGRVDTAFSLLSHESGVLSSLNMGWRTRVPQPMPLQVFGKEASLTVSEKEILLTANESGEVEKMPFQQEDGYYLQLMEFHRAVSENSPPSISTESAAHDVEVILAILESAEKNTVVRLQS
ncbi:MAG: Gfo/Idh/MocA family oxidoreductase [Candidatus Glassbacteria bacterium]|nr:Gfo/Idh/MocA family oxidoreductase [Candidatus Glassbacteria bacterium]